MNTTFDTVYKDYPVKPYIFPNLDMEGPKPVPKRKMKLLEDNLLADDITPPMESPVWHFYNRNMILKTPIRICFKICLKSMFSHFFSKQIFI